MIVSTSPSDEIVLSSPPHLSVISPNSPSCYFVNEEPITHETYSPSFECLCEMSETPTNPSFDAKTPSIGLTTPSSGGRTPTNPSANAISIPPGNRLRQPVPPSPLSRIQSEPSSGSSSKSGSSHMTTSPSSYTPKTNIPESSPCFIHSHLDRHGSLQDWLKNKAGSGHHPGMSHSHSHSSSSSGQRAGGGTHLHNGPTPVRAAPHPHHIPSPRAHHAHSPAHHHSHARPHAASPTPPATSPNSSKVTSPTLGAQVNGSSGHGKESSNGGYESDRSSHVGGSAILDGDLIDDDEEGGSLTKQLAETAQGVREMSKELGELWMLRYG